MNFSQDYFDKETRYGFETSSLMKRCWAAQIEVLQMFDEVCKKYDITYYLAYGSLLGAVRDGRIIPWDDDIDIMVLPDDMQKIFQYARKDFEKLGLELTSPFTDKEYINLCFRLINTSGYRLEEDFLKKYWLFPFMAGLDLFPLYYLPRDPEQERLMLMLEASATTLVLRWNDEDLSLEEKEETYKMLIEMLGVEAVPEEERVNQLMKLADRICAMYSAEEADRVAVIPYYYKNNKKFFKKEWFEETIYKDFEGLSVPCPKNYKEILEVSFGPDFLIPQRSGGAHDYPYYRKAYNKMMEVLATNGIPCPEIYKEL